MGLGFRSTINDDSNRISLDWTITIETRNAKNGEHARILGMRLLRLLPFPTERILPEYS